MTTTARWMVLLGLALAWPALAGERQSGGESRPFRTPPQEARSACASLKLGDACSFTFDGRAHAGTCRRGPAGEGPIACAPDHGGEPRGEPRGEAGERTLEQRDR